MKLLLTETFHDVWCLDLETCKALQCDFRAKALRSFNNLSSVKSGILHFSSWKLTCL